MAEIEVYVSAAPVRVDVSGAQGPAGIDDPQSAFSTNKASITNDDRFAMLDSASANIPKHTLWSLIKSTLKTYFDSIYHTTGGALGTPASGNLTNCTFPTLNQNTTGNAATVTTINGRISAGSNVTLSGSGTAASPYVIAASGGGGGGGASAFVDLTDKASADLPTINTPLSTALGLLAPLANPTFTGTVTIPAGASIDGYLASATASSTYSKQIISGTTTPTDITITGASSGAYYIAGDAITLTLPDAAGLEGVRFWVYAGTGDFTISGFLSRREDESFVSTILPADGLCEIENIAGQWILTRGAATPATHEHSGADITSGNIAVARIATALTTPGPIGGTTPAAISATTVTASGAVTLAGGATITGASGDVTVAATGTNKNVFASPTGTGGFGVGGTPNGFEKIRVETSHGYFAIRNDNPIQFQLRPNSGKNGWFGFTENGVADRWVVGITAGSDLLRFRDNGVGGTDRLTLSSSGNLTASGAIITTPQALSGAGAVDIVTAITKLTTTGASQALTLANGVDGQRKTIIHEVDGGSAILTPTTKTGYTTITFTEVGDSVTLVYFTTRGWMIESLRGAIAA